MSFVAPAALAFTALALPIVALYMLRTRRARTRVSSTMLWGLSHQPVTANTPWQPLRFSVLLLLQLLVLILIVLALAGPARPSSAPLADHTVLIVDTSASMQASAGGTSRLDEARRAAADTVGRLGAGQRMSIVEAGPRARVVLSGSSDRRGLLRALDAFVPTDGRADIAGAFALASSLETAAESTIVHLFSDGAIDDEARAIVPPGLVHVRTGSDAGNVGIERISPSPAGGGWDVFVRVRNAGERTVDAAIALTDGRGTRLARAPVRLDPGVAEDIRMQIPPVADGRVVARLQDVRADTATAETINALAADDEARVVLDASTTTRVLLMTPGNLFLESLLDTIPGVEVTVSERAAPTRGATLAVYDRVDPPEALTVPSIVIAAPGGAPSVRLRPGLAEGPVITFAAPREEVLAHVDVSGIAVRQAQRIDAPRLRTLIGAGDLPMLAAGIPGGVRMAYVAFDLHQSNLPVQVAFPVLFGNLLTWLTDAGGDGRMAVTAGEPLPLRIPGGAEAVLVTTPDGTEAEVGTARTTFDDTARAGFYQVRASAGDETLATQTVAVNVAPDEHDLTTAPVTAPPRTDVAGRPLAGLASIGPGLLALALAILLLEWWWAHGRPTPRRRYHREQPA